MTISCNCPKCERVCGFKDEYAGHRARCLHCDTKFIIPSPDDAMQHAVEIVEAEPEGPLPGFYEAVFKENWKIFAQKESVVGIILCIALTCFHFFIGDKDYSFRVPGLMIQGQIGWVTTFITAGYLLWYFIEIINVTTVDCDFLPEIDIGDFFAFVYAAAKSIYCFFAAFVVALLPAAILLNLLAAAHLSFPVLDVMIIITAFMMVPFLLSMLAANIAPWMLFRYDRIVVNITKSFRPYMVTAGITLFAFVLIFLTIGYFEETTQKTFPRALMLTGRLLAVFATIFAMRTIGLYIRHYYECFPELKVPEY
ncbi:MAG: hypothetical protein ACYSUT_11855 [Planctomycetota bacterium]